MITHPAHSDRTESTEICILPFLAPKFAEVLDELTKSIEAHPIQRLL